MEGQLQHLAELNKLPEATLKSQLEVTFQLLKLFRQSYPHCLLVPYGSTITGLGTHHSDCDLCLIPTPSTALTHVLSGRSYFSPVQLQIVERLEKEYKIKWRPSPSPPTPESVEVMTLNEVSAPLQTSSSRYMREYLYAPILERLSSRLSSLEGYTDIVSVPRARCPILRFHHKPTSLHYDMCINSV